MKKDLLILLLLILPAIAALFQPGFFPMHDNLQPMRQLQMDKCFQDGQFPCRWVSDMGLGYGYPLFNYYPPLPYYLGQLFVETGFSFIDTIKAVGIIGFAVTAIFMYLFARQFWGRAGGLISAAFYTYAPYHAVDFYVRGAMNEFWAMAFYPAIFCTSYRLIYSPSPKWLIGLSLSLALLMLSHNPMLLIFTPFFILWMLFWIIKTKKYASIKWLVPSALFALGLSSFFTIPVILEKNFVHIETLTVGYFNYLQHFLDIDQLFLHIYWGYGSSGLGQRTMSFAIGYLHWIIPLVIFLFLFISKKLNNSRFLLLLLYSFLSCSLFMTHSRSTFIWEKISMLSILQFPWRFLTLSAFFSSFISGGIVYLFSSKKITLLLLSCSSTLLLLLNASYFQPQLWNSSQTDTEIFSGKSWKNLTAASIYDFLPKTAFRPPADPVDSDLYLIDGHATYKTISKKSQLQLYEVNVTSSQVIAEIQTFYFPGWKVYLDGQLQSIDPNKDPLFGRMQIVVPKGNHQIKAHFTSTPVRKISDLLSLISWVGLLGIISIWIVKLRWGKSISQPSNPVHLQV